MILKFAEGVPDASALVELELAASEPYGAFVYEDEEQRRAVAELLVSRGVGEFVPPLGRVLVGPGGETIGMMAGPLRRKELARSRMDAARALHGHPLLARTPGVLDRTRIAREALVQVGDDDVYLSRMAVDPLSRGRSLAHLIFQRFLEDSRALGARRVVCEVEPTNARCERVVLAYGFELVDERRVQDDATGRSLTYRHLALVL
jgi:ribosomal protein S18 acetylase RimI-like enzyme